MSNVFLAKLNPDGTLGFDSRYNAIRFDIFAEKNADKYVRIELVAPKRSNQQNRYYWLCLETIANHCGHTPEELHRFFKSQFLQPKLFKWRNKEYKMSGSTTDLNKSDFVEYMMRIEAEAASMGIVLPDPKMFETGFITRQAVQI